jgi:predicted aminopeptidase
MLRRLALAALVVAVGLAVGTSTGRYLLRAAWEEGRILWRRRPIADVIADRTTERATRAKLQLVLDARQYAADSLGLRAGESFTTYSRLPGDTLVLVLSGAWRDRLAPYTWWFPIVGHVPYKGFFVTRDAVRAQDALRARGFDTYLRPSPAFSTLGFFNDPVLSTSLEADSIELANTVFHELTHNTYYASDQAIFNESFANIVGARASAAFFRSRQAPAAAATADLRWADDTILGNFWTALYQALDSAFRVHPTDRAARLAARDTLFAAARARLVSGVAPTLRTIPAGYLARARIDNAALLARRIYLTDLPLFDRVDLRCGGDIRRTAAEIIALARSTPDDPFAGVRAWVRAPDATCGHPSSALGP